MFKKLLWALRALVYKLVFRQIGAFSYLGQPTFILGGKSILIGRRVRIFPGIRLECHHGGSIVIEDGVSIAQNVHITAGFGPLVIGQGSVILANSCVTNIIHSYDEVGISPSQKPMSFKRTSIGRNCFIGFGSVILPGSELGEGCVVGANSTVRSSFPSFSVVLGSPAKLKKRISA